MKAKFFNVFVAMALFLTISGVAEAQTVPDYPEGYIGTRARDQDNGSIYVDNDGDPPTPYEIFDPDGNTDFTRIKPEGAMAQYDYLGNMISSELEDTYGLFHMHQISAGIVSSDGTAILPGSTVWDNSGGTQDTWLVGMIYGGNDTYVSLETPTADHITDFSVLVDDVSFELWAVQKSDLGAGGNFDENNLVPYGARKRTAYNRYDGWLDATTTANGVKLLTGKSTWFESSGWVEVNGKFQGNTQVFFDIDENDPSGLWNDRWGVGAWFIDPDGDPADWRVSFTLEPGTLRWLTHSSDPGGLYIIPEQEYGCRVTGGGNDTFTEDGLGPLDDKLANAESDENGYRYTFGGQAGSPTGCQPQPWGNWTHSHHSGMKARFTFHAGTASAPEGTEIDWIECSDPPCCLPAREAPTKQIDFDGVGTFKNIRLKNGSPLSWIKKVDEVTGEPALFDFYVHIEDLGEPGKGGKVDPPGDDCPPAGSAGGLANCSCPDFYWITIFNPDGDDYTVYGYIKGGNLQIHPPHDCK